jgi:hypothetical protein
VGRGFRDARARSYLPLRGVKMRRYLSSPSIPFDIARVHGVQKPARSSVRATEAEPGTLRRVEGSEAPVRLKNEPQLFLWSLWLSGVSVGVGLALELNGMSQPGVFSQAFGFLVAAVSIILHPGDDGHE